MNAINTQRPYDVLDGVLTKELIVERQFAFDLVVRCAREADAAALGEAFEARRDVDAVAVDPFALDDHVAEIDSNSEPHAACVGQAGVPDLQLTLDVDAALDGVDDPRESRQHVVAGRVHHTAAVLRHRRRHHPTIFGDRADSGRLIVAHETAIAFDVSAQNRRELALYRASVHDAKFYARWRETALVRLHNREDGPCGRFGAYGDRATSRP